VHFPDRTSPILAIGAWCCENVALGCKRVTNAAGREIAYALEHALSANHPLEYDRIMAVPVMSDTSMFSGLIEACVAMARRA
jgi:hypothetical protein